MSADFWASYASGALGILIGNRLDVIKVQAQAGLARSTPPTLPTATPPPNSPQSESLKRLTSLFRGAAAPVLGYGALNSILFMTYNRTLQHLEPSIFDYTKLAGVSLSKIWVAGAIGGLATWVISAPSEYIKCRAQLVVDGQGSSLGVARETMRREGIKGLYRGGVITSLRDGVGYGWYFWSYEVTKRIMLGSRSHDPFAEMRALEVLVAGGIAGVVTWLSIYPLDIVKTRLQTQSVKAERVGLLDGRPVQRSLGSVEVAREIWREAGLRGFYRGVGVCSLRAFVVNAAQWYAYERMMWWLSPGKLKEPASLGL